MESTQTKRAFVAVRPPDDVLEAVAALGVDVSGGRMTTPDQWHVTLQFLGNRADIDAVADALDGFDVTAGSARLGGLGAFRSARRATVVWIGLAEGEELFAALAAEVAVRLRPLGFEPEARAFHPHLTLARLKTPADVTSLVDDRPVGRQWTVDTLTVYESRTRPTGAEYVARASIPLP